MTGEEELGGLAGFLWAEMERADEGQVLRYRGYNIRPRSYEVLAGPNDPAGWIPYAEVWLDRRARSRSSRCRFRTESWRQEKKRTASLCRWLARGSAKRGEDAIREE